MTTYERLEEIKNNTEIDLATAHDTYNKVELELAKLLGEYVLGAEVSCQTYGPGHVVAYSGSTLDSIIVDVEFATITKKFSLPHIINVAKFIKFEDIFEIGSIWDEAFAIHTDLTFKFKELDRITKQQAAEAKKKAEEERKAEEKYQKAKAKAIADFEELSQTARPISTVDEFYYSLGWLAKNAGTVSAAMPDYLLSFFEGRFGTEYKPTVVDSKKRTVNGYAMQWALSMKASLPKKVEGKVPAFLTKYLSTSGNAVSDTSFIWDLVDNYGFKFGKKQDIENIRTHIPSTYLEFFETGLA
jgi:hypothetical protein